MSRIQFNKRIPPSFKKHIIGRINNRSVLRSNCGGRREWKVQIGNVEGDLYFQDGWERFVRDHDVSLGEFMVFFYDGNVGFDVKIYGNSGCEKMVQISLMTETESSKFNEQPVKVPHQVPVKTEVLSDTSNEESVEVLPKVSRRKRKKVVEYKSSNGESSRMKKNKQSKPYDNEKAMEAACSFKATHPSYVKTCKNRGTNYMTIPKELQEKYDLDKKDSIVLRNSLGTSTTVKLSSWTDGRICLGAGWFRFYDDNNLKEGDVCILEFMEEGTAINVHIFRAEEYRTKSIPEADTGEHLVKVEDLERVLNATEPVEPRNPTFTVNWDLSKLYQVPIPKSVALEAGITKKQEATLFDPAGKSWTVLINLSPTGQAMLSGGWCHVCRENNMSAGDKCMFEFLGGADTLKVHVTRGEEAGSPAAAAMQQAPRTE